MKENLEQLLNIMCDTGASYSDIFLEEKQENNVKLLDGKIDKVEFNFIKGAGLRICDDYNTFYSAINNYDLEDLKNQALKLKDNLEKERILSNIKLENLVDNSNRDEGCNLTLTEKKNYLLNIDKIARKFSDKIFQVSASFQESEQVVEIATSDSKYIKDKRFLKRLIVVVMAEENDKKTRSVYSIGSSFDYEFLNKINIEDEIKQLCQTAIDKLNAPYAPTGLMPVIIGNNSGVLIHEACGHALEATSVADDASVLAKSLGKQVASKIVNIIDDGTLENKFGSTYYDDEGELTKRNVLIKDGVLTSYLVDKKNSSRMSHSVTGSSRRESYYLAPTSRMNNTYLDNGDAKLDDMIKSIEFGLYAKDMGGGEVNPVTGDFNFGVDEAYVIRDGKVCEMVVGASLIGNIKDVLNNIVAVSDDLNFDTGICGSESGWCPVTCGQPTIKLSSILVGGKND